MQRAIARKEHILWLQLNLSHEHYRKNPVLMDIRRAERRNGAPWYSQKVAEKAKRNR